MATTVVTSGYRVQPPGVTIEQLQRVLTALASPPSFHLPPATTAHTRHYDVANQSVKFFDTFIVLNPADAVVWVWSGAELDEADRQALATLLTALGTFGRAESWCEATLITPDTVPEPNSTPLVDERPLAGLEPVRVLMPDAQPPDLLETLMIETSTMRKKKHLDPPGSHWVTYTRLATALTDGGVAPPRHPTIPQKMTVARYALDATVLPPVQDALPFAEQIRRALIRSYTGASHSRALVGKSVDGTPLEGHLHAHYLATDENGDGRLDHVTIYAPCGFDAADVAALGKLTRIFRRGNRPEVRTVLIGLSSQEQFDQVPLLASSRRWGSVTPFSLPRFAARGAGKPPRPRDLPEAQLRRELRMRHLPEPIAIKHIEGYSAPHRPLVRWLDFHTQRFKGERGYGLAGFELEFPEVIAGPLCLGFACHFSLGLFLPL